MLETAELGRKIDKATYERTLPALRKALLDAQYEFYEQRRRPLLIILDGAEGGGRTESANALLSWLDAHHLDTHPDLEANGEEQARPPMWRFWRRLPERGRGGLYFSGWYDDPIRQRIDGRINRDRLDARLEAINRFEKMQVDDGAVVVKLWFHLSRQNQKKRLKALEADPATAWRITENEWKHYRQYQRLREIWERVLRESSTEWAPWHVIDGYDRHYRELTIGQILLDALNRANDTPPPAKPAASRRKAAQPVVGDRTLLSTLDLGQKVEGKAYTEELNHWQARLFKAVRRKAFRERGVVAVFEGYDAAGKGGAIRRVTEALDARDYRVVAISAPSETERAHHYLWRFWRQLPERGRLALFDRSWYGRVLVERVDRLTPEPVWRRGYSEINAFEEELSRSGLILAKFFLYISAEEQLKRFESRRDTPFKRFKLTEDDWHNRDQRPVYDQAVCDMVERTSTEIAPWTLVEAEDKRFSRLKILRTLVTRIEDAL